MTPSGKFDVCDAPVTGAGHEHVACGVWVGRGTRDCFCWRALIATRSWGFITGFWGSGRRPTGSVSVDGVWKIIDGAGGDGGGGLRRRRGRGRGTRRFELVAEHASVGSIESSFV